MTKKLLTLCIVHQNNRVLLGMKKRGFGAGWWNGFGGKVLPGEEIEDAAKREALEEAGIVITDMEKMGILQFEFVDNPEILKVHIFKATKFTGEPVETEEMKPQWFQVSEIPYKTMWPDDVYWLPLLLENKKFTGRFLLGEGNRILEQALKESDTMKI